MNHERETGIAHARSKRKGTSNLPQIAAVCVKKKLKTRRVTLDKSKIKLPPIKTKAECQEKVGSRLYLVDCLTISHLPEIIKTRKKVEKREYNTSGESFATKPKRNKPICLTVAAGAAKNPSPCEESMHMPPQIQRISPQSVDEQIFEILQWDVCSEEIGTRIGKARRIMKSCYSVVYKQERKVQESTLLCKKYKPTYGTMRRASKGNLGVHVSGEKVEHKFDFDEFVIEMVRNANCF